MPMHDWTRVDAGIYHAFHHEWISEIHRADRQKRREKIAAAIRRAADDARN